MLPFLKKKEGGNAGLMIKTRAPDEKPESDSPDHSEMIKQCAQDLISAVQAGNVQGVADALQDAFSIMDAAPHVEGEHIEPHSYDAQNIKAGK